MVPGTEQISQLNQRKMAFFEGCPVGWGGTRARGGSKGFGSGGVGGRGTGPRDGANFDVSKKPTGLVDRGVDQGPWLQERVGGA